MSQLAISGWVRSAPPQASIRLSHSSHPFPVLRRSAASDIPGDVVTSTLRCTGSLEPLPQLYLHRLLHKPHRLVDPQHRAVACVVTRSNLGVAAFAREAHAADLERHRHAAAAVRARHRGKALLENVWQDQILRQLTQPNVPIAVLHQEERVRQEVWRGERIVPPLLEARHRDRLERWLIL